MNMTSRNRILVIITGVLVVAGGILSVSTFSMAAQRQKNAKSAASVIIQDPRFNFPVAPTTMTTEAHSRMALGFAGYTVEPAMVEPGKARSAAEQQDLEKVAEILTRLAPVPTQRQAYFDWLNRPDSAVRFKSWGCLLQEAKPINGGWEVRLTAMARGTDAQGQHIDIFNRFLEEYTLNDAGELHFVRCSAHPDDNAKPRFGRTGL